MIESILILASAAATPTKAIIDILRVSLDRLGEIPSIPQWVSTLADVIKALSPLLALLLAPFIVAGLFVSQEMVLTPALQAQAVIAGIMAAVGAIGVTELQKKAQ